MLRSTWSGTAVFNQNLCINARRENLTGPAKIVDMLHTVAGTVSHITFIYYFRLHQVQILFSYSSVNIILPLLLKGCQH